MGDYVFCINPSYMNTELIIQLILLLILVIAGIWFSPYDVNFEDEEHG